MEKRLKIMVEERQIIEETTEEIYKKTFNDEGIKLPIYFAFAGH